MSRSKYYKFRLWLTHIVGYSMKYHIKIDKKKKKRNLPALTNNNEEF